VLLNWTPLQGDGETGDETQQVGTLFDQIGLHPVYTLQFHQLACNINWDKQALCDHFHQGLEMK
jgi:hypothetical protein